MALLFTSIASSFSGQTRPAVFERKRVTAKVTRFIFILTLIRAVDTSSTAAVSLILELLYRRSRFLLDSNRVGIVGSRVVMRE